jgi:hypothetical protein
MNVKSVYGAELADLRKKYLAKNEPFAESGFFMFENLEENAVLFIGLNPSEVQDNEEEYDVKKEDGIYWGDIKRFNVKHPYYQHFDDLACGMKWAHLDIYFSYAKKRESLDKMAGSEFLKDQFTISEEIIQELAPKIIVVGSAYVSHLIQKNFCCKWGEGIGTYSIKEFNDAPIFFSGVFTGARALDVGSRERLAWHIGFVKEKLI